MLNGKARTVGNLVEGAARRKLSNRRASITFNFQCNSLAYSATISRYPNGELAEIFIKTARSVLTAIRPQKIPLSFARLLSNTASRLAPSVKPF